MKQESHKTPSISLIIPTYNEKENVRAFILSLEEIFRDVPREMVVVDDSSPDGTGEEVLRLQRDIPNLFLVTRAIKDGVGGALRAGYDYAKNDILLSCDADFSYSLNDLRVIYETLVQEHYDMVVGSRYGGAALYETPRWSIALKYAVSRSGNWLLRTLFHMPVHDFSANCRALRRVTWQKLSTHDSGNFFLFETIFFAEKMGARIGEVLVSFLDRKSGASKINHIFEACKALYKMFVFFIRYSLLGQEARG